MTAEPSPAPAPRPPAPARMVRGYSTWAIYALLALFAYIETTLGPAMPFIRDHLGIGYTVASLHFSTLAAGAIVAGLLGDRVIGQLGRRRVLWGGLAGMAGGAALLALSPWVVGTLIGTLAIGLLGTASLMANQAALSDIHGAHRTVALAESNVAASSASVLAPLAVGGLAATVAGWQSALLLALPLFALCVWRFGCAPIPSAPARDPAAPDQRGLPRVFWYYCAALFMASAVEWTVAYWGADFLTDIVGMSKGAAATAMSLFFGAMIVGRFTGARLARKLAGTTLLLGACLLALLGFPLFWLGGSPPVSLLGLFVAGLGVANFYPLIIAVATGVAADRADQATARLAIGGGSALLLVPLVVGAISDAVGMRWGFGVVLPLITAALLMTLGGIRESGGRLVSRVVPNPFGAS